MTVTIFKRLANVDPSFSANIRKGDKVKVFTSLDEWELVEAKTDSGTREFILDEEGESEDLVFVYDEISIAVWNGSFWVGE